MGTYERIDYKIDKALDKLKGDATESVIILQEYPEINYVLAYRKSNIQPWVAAWAYNGKNSWGQGHYFANLVDAIEYIRTVQGRINYYRMDEIASKAINHIIETDVDDAEEFFEELDLENDEIKYFCIEENINEARGYDEDEEDEENYEWDESGCFEGICDYAGTAVEEDDEDEDM